MFCFIYSFQLDDAALQVYKDGDYGAYLDLESSLAEQSEEIEGLNAKWVAINNTFMVLVADNNIIVLSGLNAFNSIG